MSETAAIAVDVVTMITSVAALVGFLKYKQRLAGVLSWIVLCGINITSLSRNHHSWWLITAATVGCALWPITVAWSAWRRNRANTPAS